MKPLNMTTDLKGHTVQEQATRKPFGLANILLFVLASSVY